MATTKVKTGHKGPRAKSSSDSYYKGRYIIAFYEDEGDDETFRIAFNNVTEICKYKGLEVNTSNINMIHQALYLALNEKNEPTTKLIDNVRLKVYLIDMIDEIRENERREKEMKKFVNITSTKNLEVYPDLDALDTTNPSSPMADRLSVKPNWVYPIKIKKGVHYYPAEIKNWGSIQELKKLKVLSIAEEVDEVPAEEKAVCEEMRKKMAKILARTKTSSNKPSQAKPEPKTEVSAN